MIFRKDWKEISMQQSMESSLISSTRSEPKAIKLQKNLNKKICGGAQTMKAPAPQSTH